MTRRKTDDEFRKEVKALVGDEYLPLDSYSGSSTKIRFQHQKCSHIFSMTPNNFLSGNRCPKCRYIRKTDDEFKNEVTKIVGKEYKVLGEYKKADQKIKLKHLKCGNTFEMRPDSFLCGARCPKCSWAKANAKKRKAPETFRKEFRHLAGKYYILVSDYKSSKEKITVFHLKCGSLYKTLPGSFLRGRRCPYCAVDNKRMTENEWISKLHKIGEGKYRALQKYNGYDEKILMLHNKCKRKYYVTPDQFIRGHKCPFCQREKRALNQVVPFSVTNHKVKALTNGEYIILEKGYRGTNKKAIFCHQKCKHKFKMTPHNFFQGKRCPFCRSSKGERIVEEYLTDRGILFKTQFTFKGCKDKRALPFDFAVFNSDQTLNCLIEYQGEQHFYNPFTWKRKDGPFNIQSISNTQKHDAIKLQYCKKHGIKLIRINHPQIDAKSNSIEFIERLVNRTLSKELHVV